MRIFLNRSCAPTMYGAPVGGGGEASLAYIVTSLRENCSTARMPLRLGGALQDKEVIQAKSPFVSRLLRPILCIPANTLRKILCRTSEEAHFNSRRQA